MRATLSAIPNSHETLQALPVSARRVRIVSPGRQYTSGIDGMTARVAAFGVVTRLEFQVGRIIGFAYILCRMHIDPALPVIVGAILAILLIGLALRALRQPQIVGYIIAGIVIGPYGIGLLDDPDLIGRIGGIGLIVLLFFVGMEASPGSLLSRWQLAIFGVMLQVAATVAIVWAIGSMFDWRWSQVLIFGFVISLSSTAVVLKLLKDWNELGTQTGQNVLVVLLAQDMALVPMIIAVNVMGGEQVATGELLAQLVGAVVLVGIAAWVFTRDHVRLPFAAKLQSRSRAAGIRGADAVLWPGTDFGRTRLVDGAGRVRCRSGRQLGARNGLGARKSRAVSHRFRGRVFCLGRHADRRRLRSRQYCHLGLLVAAVVLVNTVLNTAILRLLGSSWRRAGYAGALLSQIGEFSFILAALAHTEQMLTDDDYRLIVAVIAISLMLSPAWIGLCKLILGHPEGKPDRPRVA